MSKPTKYEYLHVVQGHYGQGWEDVCQSLSHREARGDLRAYRENCPEYAHRMIGRRELRLVCPVCRVRFHPLSGGVEGCPVHGIREGVQP